MTMTYYPANQNRGGALKVGFDIALRDDATFIATIDSDNQHPVEKLDRLVSPITDD